MSQVVIYKYDLNEIQGVIPYRVSKILHVGVDYTGNGKIWVEHPLDSESSPIPEPSEVKVVGTGQIFTPYGSHVGTFTQGAFVWHVYGPIALSGGGA